MKLSIRTLSADCDTPVSVFSRLRDPHGCFLFESAEGGEHWGRYSILGFDPLCTARETVDGSISIRYRNGTVEQRQETLHDWLRHRVLAQAAIDNDAELPFCGGAVGYFSYDLVHRLENIPCRHLHSDDEMGAFMLIDRFIIFDNLRGCMHLCVLSEQDTEAQQQLDTMQEQLRSKPYPAPLELDIEQSDIRPEAHLQQEDFEAMVQQAKEYILAGDVFQVVLSQRFSAPVSGDPLSIYRAVRHINPSPYLFYLHVGDTLQIGSSPEILVRKEGKRAIVRPIAGTRPRGCNQEHDLRLEQELLADEKERAEHVMLVDLGRNDLGRVCDYGSVRLTESMGIERYSHVMHIVSQVEGELRDDVDALDLLSATFPAGTVSGAPKVRAMQIIDELEQEARGPYAGTVGYFSYGGENMDTAITIRTAVIRQQRVYVQAGAGIVADSVAATEHQECVNKASAMFRAVHLAQEQD